MQSPKFRLTIILGAVLMVIGTQSCVSYKSQLLLREEKEKGLEVESTKAISELPGRSYKEIQIRPFDLVMIKINPFEGNTEEFLNREFASSATFSRQINYEPSSIYYNSYLVSEDGTLDLPMLGEVKVEGMTTTELKKMLDKEYEPYVKEVATTVKIANLRVTVLGEVENPGLVYLYNDRTTILEAISLAGDFGDFSNRENVKLIRQLDNTGRAKTVVLNLKKPDFINTEYYYVQPDDVIYVEPQKAKSFDISARSFGLVLSTVSVLAVITGIVIR